MDPVTLATGAVSLLAPYLAKAGKTIADKVGNDASNIVNNKIGTLYESIKNKFLGNNYASDTLKRLEEEPEDEDRKNAMRGVLKDVLAKDQQFQETLDRLLTEVKQLGGNNIIQVYGGGAIATDGGIAAGERGIAAGRDVVTGNPHFKNEE